jgi:hypothetical protein
LLVAGVVAGILAGCSSSPAIMAAGPGAYTLTKEGPIGSSGLEKLKTNALQEANQYCATNGREALLVGAKEQNSPYLMSNYVTAEINFRCVATQALREAPKAAVLECRDRRLNKEFKTYRQSAECSNPKILTAYEGSNYPFMDLVHVLLAARLVAAENLDAGAVTEAQAQQQAAELERRLMAEDQRRRLAAADFQAEQTPGDPVQAQATFVQGLDAFQTSTRPHAKRPPPHRTELACNAVGFSGGLATASCY